MKTRFNTWSAALVAAASFTALGSISQAQTYTEVGDAGDTLATAQTVTGPSGTAISSISGSFGSTGTDADLYVINISSPTTFSASTNNATTNTAFTSGGLTAGPLDTALFLFNASGVEIATNDDTATGTGNVVTSTLAAGDALYASLPAGKYYLGISISGNEPVNSVGQLLFALNDDPASTRGPEGANNLGPQNPASTGIAADATGTILSSFNQDNYDDESGNYQIDLNGVMGVPEPSTWALIALGGGAAGCLSARRRQTHRA